MKLKTRSVTILTDDEVALVSGGLITRYSSECYATSPHNGCMDSWPDCNNTYPYTESMECPPNSDDCDTVGCPDPESEPCNTETSGCPTYTDSCNSYTDACNYTTRCGGGGTIP